MRTTLLALALLFFSVCPVFAQEHAAAGSRQSIYISESTPTTSKDKDPVPGWFAETREGDFEIGLDTTEKHGGTSSAHMKSVVASPREFGNLTNWFMAREYIGKRLRMTAWVKTKLTSGTAQLWLRIDGDWESGAQHGCFDNMNDRPIKGVTDWTKYNLVVDVPKNSTDIVFGFMLIGTGEAWLDDVNFEAVGKDVPLTGDFGGTKRKSPANLNFEEHP